MMRKLTIFIILLALTPALKATIGDSAIILDQKAGIVFLKTTSLVLKFDPKHSEIVTELTLKDLNLLMAGDSISKIIHKLSITELFPVRVKASDAEYTVYAQADKLNFIFNDQVVTPRMINLFILLINYSPFLLIFLFLLDFNRKNKEKELEAKKIKFRLRTLLIFINAAAISAHLMFALSIFPVIILILWLMVGVSAKEYKHSLLSVIIMFIIFLSIILSVIIIQSNAVSFWMLLQYNITILLVSLITYAAKRFYLKNKLTKTSVHEITIKTNKKLN